MEPETTLKVGDVVTLKSGGPKMTVNSVIDGAVNCVWFDVSEDGYFYGSGHHDQFNPNSLKKE